MPPTKAQKSRDFVQDNMKVDIRRNLRNYIHKAQEGDEIEFAYLCKVSQVGGVLLMGKKLRDTDLMDARKAFGGLVNFRGMCHCEGDVLVFEINKPAPAGLRTALKKTIAEETRADIYDVEVREVAYVEEVV